jgi:hypothetical protein
MADLILVYGVTRALEVDANLPPVMRFTRPRQVEDWLAERPLRFE